MTLAQLIAAHEARVPQPINRPTATLTSLGTAAVAIIRLRRQVLALGAADRAWCAETLRSLAADIEPATA
jgi:hypothetical protein